MSSDRKKNTRILLICLIGFGLLFAALVFFWDQGFNWHQHSFDRDDKEPYGADLTYSYLEGLRAKDDFMLMDSAIVQNLRPLLLDSATSNYLIFGYAPYIDSLTKAKISEYVSQGNNFFLLTGAVDAELLSEWHDGECLLYEKDYPYDFHFEDGLAMELPNTIQDSVVSINLTHPQLRVDSGYQFGHHVEDKLRRYNWSYMDSAYFCPDNRSLTALGTINNQVNFFRVQEGQGFYYVHTNPKLLTNYYLATQSGRDYADKVFAHLGEGPILWDDKKWKADIDQFYKERYFQQDGPLTYLLSQESLRWMLYTVLIMAVIFFMFESKRMQRAIPVMRPKENSSMEYVDTVAELYFDQSGDAQIFRYLSDQFQFFVRKRYRVNFKWAEEESKKSLAKASGIAIEHLNTMTSVHAKGSYAPNVDNVMLSEYYQLMDHFYTNCK